MKVSHVETDVVTNVVSKRCLWKPFLSICRPLLLSQMSTDEEFHPKSGRGDPTILTISFESDPTSSLGAVLVNHDKEQDADMFVPGFASISRLLEGETIARKLGARVGDIIVAVNGEGFRRFAPDHQPAERTSDPHVETDDKVVASGGAYDALLAKIKAIKLAAPDPPLVLKMERYDWDARPHSWGRFLSARDGNVPLAMQMMQQHEQWRSTMFPISLKQASLRRILETRAVSEIDVDHSDLPPSVYVNYARLLELQSTGEITADDVVAAFVIFTEQLLAASTDVRRPQTIQFIDMSGVGISSGFRTETLRKIYNTFEPNYPETLCKMIMYPISTMVAATARTMLSFVNETTQKKFVLTNKIDTVCKETGWDVKDVEACGGISAFMLKHAKVDGTQS